jgi:hypothetical protein
MVGTQGVCLIAQGSTIDAKAVELVIVVRTFPQNNFSVDGGVCKL